MKRYAPGPMARVASRCRALLGGLVVPLCIAGLLLTAAQPAGARAPYRPALVLDEITIPVAELDAAARFYKELLGLRQVNRDENSVTLASSLGSALRFQRAERSVTGMQLLFKTDSLAAVGLALRQRGVDSKLENGDGGLRLMVRDPFGNLLVVSEQFTPSVSVTIHKIDPDGVGETLGRITLHFGPFGLVLMPDLQGLPPGRHSIHVHQFGACGPAENTDGVITPGLAAGGHYQPDEFAWMGSPVGEGTLGDLPDLYADPDGRVVGAVVAPEVRREDVIGRAIMLHARSDDMVAGGGMDHSAHMMGPNPRMACGIVPH